MNDARPATYTDLLEVWVVLNTHGERQTIRAEPFAAFDLDIGRFWLD